MFVLTIRLYIDFKHKLKKLKKTAKLKFRHLETIVDITIIYYIIEI